MTPEPARTSTFFRRGGILLLGALALLAAAQAASAAPNRATRPVGVELAVSASGQSIVVRNTSDLSIVQRSPLTGGVPWISDTVTDNPFANPTVGGSGSYMAATRDGRDVYLFATLPGRLAHLRVTMGVADLQLKYLVDGAVRAVAMSPDERSVYVTTAEELVVFRRAATTGALTPHQRIPVAAAGPSGGGYGASHVQVSPDSRFVYLRTGQGFSAAADGTLTALPGCCGWDGYLHHNQPAFSARSSFAWIDDEVWTRDAATGAWTGPAPSGVVAPFGTRTRVPAQSSPDERFLYVATNTGGDNGVPSRIRIFAVEAATGALTSVGDVSSTASCGVYGCVTPLGAPVFNAVESLVVTGDRAYMVDSWEAGITVFARNATTGALTHIEQVDDRTLDLNPPKVMAAYYASVARSGRGATRALSTTLRVRASDDRSGVRSVQLRAGRLVGGWRTYSPSLGTALVGGKRATWVRARDRVGRLGKWRWLGPVRVSTVRIDGAGRALPCGRTEATACVVTLNARTRVRTTASPAGATADQPSQFLQMVKRGTAWRLESSAQGPFDARRPISTRTFRQRGVFRLRTSLLPGDTQRGGLGTWLYVKVR